MDQHSCKAKDLQAREAALLAETARKERDIEADKYRARQEVLADAESLRLRREEFEAKVSRDFNGLLGVV